MAGSVEKQAQPTPFLPGPGPAEPQLRRRFPCIVPPLFPLEQNRRGISAALRRPLLSPAVSSPSPFGGAGSLPHPPPPPGCASAGRAGTLTTPDRLRAPPPPASAGIGGPARPRRREAGPRLPQPPASSRAEGGGSGAGRAPHRPPILHYLARLRVALARHDVTSAFPGCRPPLPAHQRGRTTAA